LKKLIIFGNGDFAEVAKYYFNSDSSFEVCAFTVHEKFIESETFSDLPVVPFEKIESIYPPNEYSIFVALVYSNLNKTRKKIFSDCKNKGYTLSSYVSSNAQIWKDFVVGEKCFIFENNVVQPFVKIGDNVILWSANHVGHHSKIGNHCFISSHVVISGRVTIEENCFLGVNSTIRDNLTIKKECVIGAGSIILNNTKENEVYSPGNTKSMNVTSEKLESI